MNTLLRVLSLSTLSGVNREHKQSGWHSGTVVWLLLVGLTGLMLAAGQMGLSGGAIVSLLLLVTLLKTRLVADYFMELRHTRLLWRMIITVYLVVVLTMIGLAYWLGTT